MCAGGGTVNMARVHILRPLRAHHGQRIQQDSSGMSSCELALKQRIGFASGSWKPLLTDVAVRGFQAHANPACCHGKATQPC